MSCHDQYGRPGVPSPARDLEQRRAGGHGDHRRVPDVPRDRADMAAFSDQLDGLVAGLPEPDGHPLEVAADHARTSLHTDPSETLVLAAWDQQIRLQLCRALVMDLPSDIREALNRVLAERLERSTVPQPSELRGLLRLPGTAFAADAAPGLPGRPRDRPSSPPALNVEPDEGGT